MSQTTRHDAWQAGDSYDLYMGRWSRQVAPRFLDWLGTGDGRDWLEVGCGTGALSAAIVARCNPKSLLSIDPSEGFIAQARKNVPDARVTFQVGDAQALPAEPASKDVIASALVLNFVPDRAKALAEMKRVARPGATIGFYVWDYPGAGMEMMNRFWKAAVALDPKARDLMEDKRFPFCTPEGLTDLVQKAGLGAAECVPIEVPTVFKDFDDYWGPFTLGAGPAPGYCTSLPPDARERLKEKLDADLPRGPDGTIPLKTRAWAVKTTTR
jgi:ubiquinone/menaquinone biosynthesis C-methylase UbiE